MRISNLEIENILSIEKACISFGDSGLVLVEGFDFDTNRANGAGKSAIFNSISYALFDKIPRKITKSEILRHGVKSGFAMVTLETESGETFCVKRGRPSGVEFFKNGQKVEMTQGEFEAKIALNYDQFLSTMYNAQDSSNRFISLNDAEKKDFIMKIMNLESFDSHKKTLNAELLALSNKKNILKTKIEGFKSTLSAYRSQIVDIDQINADILAKDIELKEVNAKIAGFFSIKEPDLSKYAALESQIEEKIIAFMQMKVSSEQKRIELSSIMNQKASAHCPDCSVGLKVIGHGVVKAADEEELKKQASKVIADIKKIEDELLKEQEVRELQKKVKLKKTEEYQEYNSAQVSIANLSGKAMAIAKEITSFKALISRNQEIEKNMLEVVNSATEAQDELMRITSEEEIIKTVASFFDPTGAPAYIMDGVIDAFNDAVGDYVSVIWPNASYSLQTYKENKDKSISTKFSENLLMNGKQTSVGSLSGGEFRALSLATDFAIIDVLANKFSIDLNPIILDEPFNGLDAAGKELVIELLDKIALKRQVWVVDHSSESKSLFTRTVRVEKKNGISNIKDV